MKFKINKDYCEPDKTKVMAMLNHYFEPSFVLTPLDFFPIVIILMVKVAIDRYRVMAPQPIINLWLPIGVKRPSSHISRLVLHELFSTKCLR